jgi:two-component system chemotaxis sensor kinase CheA
VSDSLDRLRDEFLAETEDTLAELQKDLRSLEAAGDTGDLPADLVDRVFRTLHSLKGVAAMFGLDAMSAAAHALESLLEGLRQKRFRLDAELLALLFRGQADLHAMHAAARVAGSGTPAHVEELAAAVAQALRRRAPAADVFEETLRGLPESEMRAVARARRERETVALVEWSLSESGFEAQFREMLAAVRRWGVAIGTVTTVHESPPGTVLARMVVAGGAELFALIREVTPLGAHVITPADVPITPEPAAPEDHAPSPAEPDGAAHARDEAARREAASLRVPVERIEHLLVELGELAQTTTHLEESIERSVAAGGRARMERAAIRQSLRAMDRRIRSLHDGVLGVRKIPLRGLFDRLERIFRDACVRSGKDARFIARGGDTELDKSLAESLAEPLIHLVRNAVDHGIEDPPARVAAGKSARGTVRVEARAEGDRLVVELADDGGGVDHERVLARAKALGWIGSDEDPSIDERLALIFRPGLSVKDHATSLSGRGVGLDVVREKVARLGGVLDLETGPAGTVFRLRLAPSLAVVTALEVEAAGECYFLPLTNVARVVEIASEEAGAAAHSVEVDGRSVPVRDLIAGASVAASRRRARPAILLALADRRALVLVDRVGRRRELVVRPLGDLVGPIRGIAGCAETSDGRSVLVLDPAALLEGSLAGAELAS